jgi:ABC transport system ATP-binding/permease protein
VDYKKIHKDITSVNYTPVFGDLMTSRWAYEALVVEQFKNNRFQKNFYDVEFKMSNSEYYVSFYFQKMEAIYESLQAISVKDSGALNSDYSQILENELYKLSSQTENPVFDTLAKNLKTRYNTSEYKDLFLKELNKLKSKQARILEQSKKQKEDIYYNMVDELGSVEAFLRLKQNHHNQSIANMVLDKGNYKKITLYNHEIIQLKDPIYKIPKSGYGRAHFFAPLKIIGRYRIDTYWFNLVIIWISSFLLYVLLKYDLIRLAVENIEIIKVTKGWSKKILRV